MIFVLIFKDFLIWLYNLFKVKLFRKNKTINIQLKILNKDVKEHLDHHVIKIIIFKNLNKNNKTNKIRNNIILHHQRV